MHDSLALMSSYIGHRCLLLCNFEKDLHDIKEHYTLGFAIVHPHFKFDRCKCAGLAEDALGLLEDAEAEVATRHLWHETAGKVSYFILVCLTL